MLIPSISTCLLDLPILTTSRKVFIFIHCQKTIVHPSLQPISKMIKYKFMYLKKSLKETELSRFWKMGILVYSIWIYEANPKNKSDLHNIITGFGIEIWKASWFPRILFWGATKQKVPSSKLCQILNIILKIQMKSDKKKKKKWLTLIQRSNKSQRMVWTEREKIFLGWTKHVKLHGIGMWGKRWKFLVVVEAGEGTDGCEKEKGCDLWIILERERKEELTEKIGISVSFVCLIWLGSDVWF